MTQEEVGTNPKDVPNTLNPENPITHLLRGRETSILYPLLRRTSIRHNPPKVESIELIKRLLKEDSDDAHLVPEGIKFQDTAVTNPDYIEAYMIHRSIAFEFEWDQIETLLGLLNDNQITYKDLIMFQTGLRLRETKPRYIIFKGQKVTNKLKLDWPTLLDNLDIPDIDRSNHGLVFESHVNADHVSNIVLALKLVLEFYSDTEVVTSIESLDSDALKLGFGLDPRKLKRGLIGLLSPTLVALVTNPVYGFVLPNEFDRYFASVCARLLELANYNNRNLENKRNVFIHIDELLPLAIEGMHHFSKTHESIRERSDTQIPYPSIAALPHIYNMYLEYYSVDNLQKLVPQGKSLNRDSVINAIKALNAFSRQTVQYAVSDDVLTQHDALEFWKLAIPPFKEQFADLVKILHEDPEIIHRHEPPEEITPGLFHGQSRFRSYLARFNARAATRRKSYPAVSRGNVI